MLGTQQLSPLGFPGFPNEHSVGFDSMSTEWKYKLADPSADPVGLLLYEELAFSNTSYELETKLVLSKDAGPWTFAYNLVWGAVLKWTDDPAVSPQWHWEHEISNTVGISCRSPHRIPVLGKHSERRGRGFPLPPDETVGWRLVFPTSGVAWAEDRRD